MYRPDFASFGYLRGSHCRMELHPVYYKKMLCKIWGARMNRNTVINIGGQRFDRLREQKAFYIDKTEFIREWWEYGSTVTLITRPRRFGKTLNMSTLECFFSNQYAGRSELFEGLSIYECGGEKEKYRRLQGTYPVISMSFANIKATNFEDMKYRITKVIADLYEQNRYLLEKDLLSQNEKEYYSTVKAGMRTAIASDAVHSMAGFMKRYYNKEVIVLLDEYDTPMQEAWISGYWDEAVAFLRGFFNSTFKTNPYLYKGLITGITRISRESIFSDLNNLDVVTTTSDEYAACFGFTQEEVFQALDDMGLGSEKKGVRRWYDGFNFGKYTDIYNPWSIISFIKKNGKYDAYWANTSENSLVNALIQEGSTDIKQSMEALLQGKSIIAKIDEQIVFNQLDGSENAIWSLLLAAGYLKVLETRIDGEDTIENKCNILYTLTFTNFEVNWLFRNMVNGWFQGSVKKPYNDFIKAFLLNDVDAMNEFMNKIALYSFSSFDTAKGAASDDAPERFYHGFVLGLMVELDGRFIITSNRESGFGRYDIMLTPKDRKQDCAYIIEFKVHKPRKEKDLEETLANALLQIEEKQYEAELISQGFVPEQICKYGFAFQGKECLIG